MNFAERLTADRRLVVLRLLAEAISYKLNSSVLTMRMDMLGHSVSRDLVRTEIAWLTEQGLTTSEEPVDGVVVAKLTPRGLDVSRGVVVVPGVARPGA